MAGGHGAGDLEDPDEIVDAVAAVVLAPAHIVQRGGGIEAASPSTAVGDQRVEAGAFVHFVEMRQRRAGIQLLAASSANTGGRSALLSSPSTRSEAGTMSFRPC